MNSLERRDRSRAQAVVHAYQREASKSWIITLGSVLKPLIAAALKAEREQTQKAALAIAAKFCLETFDQAPMVELRRAFGVAQPESKRRKPKGAM